MIFISVLTGSFSLVGTLFGVLSSFSLAYYSIQIKKVLPEVNNQIWLLSYFNNVYATILFIPLLALETKDISNYSKFTEYKFLLLMIIGGICGLSMGYITVLQVQVSTIWFINKLMNNYIHSNTLPAFEYFALHL